MAVRAHVRVRWATCPFPRVAASVPARGRVLEIGCGYGLFSSYLALTGPGRQVVGTDVDPGKIAHAPTSLPNARFEVAVAGQVPAGPWDAVVVVDVLYLIDPAGQESLVRRCVVELAAGGVLVVKEMAMAPKWKAAWNRVQETLAVRVLRITEGGGLTFLHPKTVGGWMAKAGLAVGHQRVDRGYPHPHHLLVGRAQ